MHVLGKLSCWIYGNNLISDYDTFYPDMHINKKNIKIRNLIKPILFKSCTQIHVDKRITFTY